MAKVGCGEAASVSRELARLFSHYKRKSLAYFSILGLKSGGTDVDPRAAQWTRPGQRVNDLRCVAQREHRYVRGR